MSMIESINSKLLDLDQLRWVLQDYEDIQKANERMWSLSNSFKRFGIFLSQKIDAINKQNAEKLKEKREEEKRAQISRSNEAADSENHDEGEERQNKSQAQHVIDDEEKLLADIDNEPQRQSERQQLGKHDLWIFNHWLDLTPNCGIEIERQEEEQDSEVDEESMSLKDVIMTLNDFYSSKLEALLSLLEKCNEGTSSSEFQSELEKIEKVVKDNEVRIPYDEDIFIGIDKNYKILKKTLAQIKDKFGPKEVIWMVCYVFNYRRRRQKQQKQQKLQKHMKT